MRVVVDSNVLLSALISPHGAPHRIYLVWRARCFELITCPTQLDELRRASRNPKLRDLLQPHRVGAMVNAMADDAVPDPPLQGHEVDDPHDAWLLALAEVASVDWLATGDRRSGLLARGRVGRTRIAMAAEFCETAI